MKLFEIKKIVIRKLDFLRVDYSIYDGLNSFNVKIGDSEVKFTEAFQFEIDIENNINKLIEG